MPHKRAKRSAREKLRSGRAPDLPPSQSLVSSGVNDIPKSMSRVLNAEVVRKTWRENQKKRQSEEGEKGGTRKRKRKDGEGGDVGKVKKTETKIGIKPGESLLHFERRVEDDMRPLVRSAMKNVNALSRTKRKEAVKEVEKLKQDTEAASSSNGKGKGKAKDADESTSAAGSRSNATQTREEHKERSSKMTEFATIASSAPKRLNDIAQAPPDIKVPPRLRKGVGSDSRSKLQRNPDSDDIEDKLGEGDTEEGRTGPGKKRNSKMDVLSPAQRRMMELERERAVTRYRMLKEARMKGKLGAAKS